MPSSSPPTVSLFQLARANPDPPMAFRVWRRGFNGILQSVFNYLIDQNLGVICWLKLPSGSSWQSEAHHYLQQVTDSTTTYWFKAEADDPHAEPLSPYQTIPLPEDYKMRGEYFLLAIADGFSLAIVVRRFRVKPGQDFLAPSPSDIDAAADGEETGVDLGGLKELNQDQKHYLKIVISVNPELMGYLLKGVQELVEVSAANYPDASAPKALLETWTSQTQLSDKVNFGLLDLLLANRFKQQEDMRQALSGLKRQASEASILSTQNEELINTMRLRDDFLSTVGQELRKPLTNIKTALTLLSSSSLKALQRQRYLDMKSCQG
ncbi:MAG: DICT sensory domain-containing protein, partial [Cyanobacteria bacterium J06659_2]